MSDTLYVTPAQVLAAQLGVELSEEDGEEPDEALKAIANAQVEADEESGPTQSGAMVLLARPFEAYRAKARIRTAKRIAEADVATAAILAESRLAAAQASIVSLEAADLEAADLEAADLEGARRALAEILSANHLAEILERIASLSSDEAPGNKPVTSDEDAELEIPGTAPIPEAGGSAPPAHRSQHP